jgi:hypothetical protein
MRRPLRFRVQRCRLPRYASLRRNVSRPVCTSAVFGGRLAAPPIRAPKRSGAGVAARGAERERRGIDAYSIRPVHRKKRSSRR